MVIAHLRPFTLVVAAACAGRPAPTPPPRAAGCYEISITQWTPSRGQAGPLLTPRIVALDPTPVQPTGVSPPRYGVRLVGGPDFSPYAPPGPPTWNEVQGSPGGFVIHFHDGLSGVLIQALPSDSGLTGTVTADSDELAPDSAGAFTTAIGSGVVRARRVPCP
jgi:hypothetical protein